MNRMKLLDIDLKEPIQIYEYPFKKCDSSAMSVFRKGKYYIAINSNKKLSSLDRDWIIEHEFQHIKNKTFYSMNASSYEINQMEIKTNDAVIEKLGLAELIFPYVESYSKISDELLEYISKETKICVNNVKHTINYLKRKRLIEVKNTLELLCEERDWNVYVLAAKLGMSIPFVQRLLDQEEFINYELLKQLCIIFNTTPHKILGVEAD